MENENNANVIANEANEDYIETINQLRANTVSRDEYLKLKADNKRLLNSLAAGETLGSTEPPVKKPTIDELRTKLFKNTDELSNLDTISTALELRQALIDEGKPDPFLPAGKNIVATDEDIAAANRVAKILQDTVDYADGDSDIFTNELQRIMIDTAPVRRAR